MCLQAFLKKHTRHICRFIDCRLLHDLEEELVARLNQMAPPRIMVINCPILALGQVAAVLEITKRHFPSMRTVLCGEYPTAFPDHIADIPRADFALAGDPEPILRNLLDYIDLPQRLRRTPGLIMGDSVKTEPYWLPRLTPLTLPDWRDIFWNEYSDDLFTRSCRAETRISRGHTGAPQDRAHGGAGTPFRQYPMDRFAALISHCSHTEIKEVILTDPPGFWTAERLGQWIQELLFIRNLQPWSITLPPMSLSRDVVVGMREAKCHRIDVVFPSCDRNALQRYGIKADWRELARTFQLLAEVGVHAHCRFWIGGPEERGGEANRIVQTIGRLTLCDYCIEPFPFAIDSPLYEEQMDGGNVPALEEWIKWSRDPWIVERPVPLWGGRETVETINGSLKHIQTSLQRSPGLAWARMKRLLRSKNWIETLEDKAIAFLQRHRKPTRP